jgi:hypothetical protein
MNEERIVHSAAMVELEVADHELDAVVFRVVVRFSPTESNYFLTFLFSIFG